MRRNKCIRVYLTDEEYKMLDYICEDGLKRASAVRIMIKATANDCFNIASDKADIFNKIYDEEVGERYE